MRDLRHNAIVKNNDDEVSKFSRAETQAGIKHFVTSCYKSISEIFQSNFVITLKFL